MAVKRVRSTDHEDDEDHHEHPLPPPSPHQDKKPKIPQSVQEQLAEIALKIASPGKGILAADESTGTIKKRFDEIKLDNTEDNRRAYRDLLISTPNLNKFVSGIILYEETLFQKSSSGVPFTSILQNEGIVIGIKVDLGLKPLPGTDGEQACQGLTDLDVRCKKYYEAGARFAKWRAAYQIDFAKGKPSELLIQTQAHDLARYAAICQANGIVPIVEPELLTDGDHDIATCAKVSEHIWATVVEHLHEKGVYLEGCLLKPNMVTSGQSAKEKAKPEEIAQLTIRTLLRTVPAAIPGVMFLSGGQTEEEASINLSVMNKVAKQSPAGGVPWRLSFSFGRALQASTIKTWNGKVENLEKAREVLIGRCKANSDAQLGIYEGKLNELGESLFEEDYIY